MSGIEAMGNLSRSGVRPLRSTARANGDQANQARSFSVEALKNGGTMEMGARLEGEGQSIREKYRGNGPAPSARRSHNSRLSPEEQIEKLGQIRKSAIEYESVFVDQLVKQMRQSPLTETAGGDTFSDIAEQPFRDFLSQNGGLGLADTIVNQVARQEGLEQTLQQNPGIMGPAWRPAIPPNLMKKQAGNLQMPPDGFENKGETAPESSGSTLKNMARGVQKMAEKESGADEKSPNKSVGMMSGEEIAYLYNEAKDGLA